MDSGWVYVPGATGRWLLRDRHGDTVLEVTPEAARRMPDAVNGRAQQKIPGAPVLRHGMPGHSECELTGGLQDGRRVYIAGDPPDQLVITRDPEPVAFAPSGEKLPELQAVLSAAVESDVYRRGRQRCGHGRSCPFPYAHVP